MTDDPADKIDSYDLFDFEARLKATIDERAIAKDIAHMAFALGRFLEIPPASVIERLLNAMEDALRAQQVRIEGFALDYVEKEALL